MDVKEIEGELIIKSCQVFQDIEAHPGTGSKANEVVTTIKLITDRRIEVGEIPFCVAKSIQILQNTKIEL